MDTLLSTGEFTRAMATLTTTVNDRFDRVESKQDDHAVRIAKLETREVKKTARGTASGWSAVISGLMVGIFEIAKHFLLSR
jgi:hypothetical protein